ncbi:MAG: CPP1-like family protein [Cyanobium sp. Prado107]|nr:CPP1-like family protein [Cyanobium sp. Prado107]
MTDLREPSSDSGSDPSAGPYERLGVSPDASFDEVQAARQARLDEAGDDPIARSRVEAAYDAVLMDRLKERQQGRVSTAARSASAREQLAPPPPRPSLPALPKVALPRVATPALTAPTLAMAEGNDRWLALGGYGALLGLLLLVPTAPAELLLALGTGLCVVVLQRRRRRFLAAVGWGFGLLSAGLLLGGLLASAVAASLPLGLPLTALQVQSLPALLLLLLGALLVA